MEVQKKAKSIPNWFNLEKYDAGANFSLLDWTLNLHFRHDLLRRIERANSKKEEFPEYVITDYDLIKSHGLLDRSNTVGKYELIKQDFNLEAMKPGLGLVYPLPLWRAVEIHDFIQSDTKLRNQLALVQYQQIHYATRNEAMRNREANLNDWYQNFYEAESYDDNYAEFGSYSPHVCVDLGAPDETLIDAFKDWLKSIRKDKEVDGYELPEKVSKKLIAKWKDSAILPYLDLWIYQEFEGVDLPSHVIGNAIYPATADFDTTESVRKTTRPNADKALAQCYGIMRHALIAEERQKSGR